ncbi:MAG TPA: S24/S26 family peptidase [Thermoanaerobaculia bacterium]|nr:S24/S26 family peptidase [Thermoanaerobaculia bacterium]
MNATELIVDLLSRGHAAEFQVHGDSMYPVIRENDTLHVEPARSFSRGDVVLVLADRGLTAHRVIARRGTTLILRGDNAPAADDPIEASQVLGRVTYVLRAGKKISVRSAAARAAAFLRRFMRSVSS